MTKLIREHEQQQVDDGDLFRDKVTSVLATIANASQATIEHDKYVTLPLFNLWVIYL
jgi:hypothetical protein